ncbi:MAG: hypothetical protein IIC95_11845, partial [Chloroflexi bacterium]|nr:hypothetical protein [Chloroflexota bacterium]
MARVVGAAAVGRGIVRLDAQRELLREGLFQHALDLKAGLGVLQLRLEPLAVGHMREAHDEVLAVDVALGGAAQQRGDVEAG